GGHGRFAPLLEGTLIREFSTDRTQSAEEPFTPAPGKTEWSAEAVSGSAAKLDTLSPTSAGPPPLPLPLRPPPPPPHHPRMGPRTGWRAARWCPAGRASVSPPTTARPPKRARVSVRS